MWTIFFVFRTCQNQLPSPFTWSLPSAPEGHPISAHFNWVHLVGWANWHTWQYYDIVIPIVIQWKTFWEASNTSSWCCVRPLIHVLSYRVIGKPATTSYELEGLSYEQILLMGLAPYLAKMSPSRRHSASMISSSCSIQHRQSICLTWRTCSIWFSPALSSELILWSPNVLMRQASHFQAMTSSLFHWLPQILYTWCGQEW